MAAISSSSLSTSSSPGRGASGASRGLSDIGARVELEGFCGEAKDVFGSCEKATSAFVRTSQWVASESRQDRARVRRILDISPAKIPCDCVVC